MSAIPATPSYALRARVAPLRRGFPLYWALVFAVPFLAIAYFTNNQLFMSNQHGVLVEKAALALSRRRLEFIGFLFPPLPFFMLVPWPRVLVAGVMAALCGGGIAWVLWPRLNDLPFPMPVRILLLITPLSTPFFLYLVTNSFTDALALFLFLVSWVAYVNFIRGGQTFSGFMAGLALGLAFFVNHYAFIFAAFYALFTPLYGEYRERGAAVAASFVIFFPALMAALVYAYVNWLFTGDPLTFLNDSASSLYGAARPAADTLSPTGIEQSFRSTIDELLGSPLYLAAALMVLARWPAGLPAFLVPVLVITGTRAFGLVYPNYFAVSTYTVFGLIALPRTIPPRWWPIFLVAAVLHTVVGYTEPLRDEVGKWKTAVVDKQIAPEDQEERDIADYLRDLPSRSVLLDDRVAYRIAARTESARPFVLPADLTFLSAENQPERFVQYILVPVEAQAEGGKVASVFPTDPPRGFRVAQSWRNWKLLERIS